MGGATQSLLSLAQQVQLSGLTCKVLFLSNEGNAIERYKQEKIQIVIAKNIYSYAHAYGAYNTFISRRPWRVVTNLFKSFSSIISVKEILLKENPRLIYLNTSVLIPFAIASKQINIPVIWHLREQIHNGNLGLRKKMIQYLFSKYPTKIIAISKVNAMALGVKNIDVIYNSVDFNVFNNNIDCSNFKAKYRLNAPFQICYVGGSVMSKGADILVESILKVLKVRSDFNLVIAGQFNRNPTKPMNKIEKCVHEMIKLNPILENVLRFTGPLENVASVICSSNILIWPANTPHFARPIMEAMVMGKPVVASNFLSSKEIVDDQIHGLRVEPTSINFSKAILELIENENTRKKMGMASYIKAKDLFDSSKNNAKIVHYIQALLN
jgi:glycosyltransferase involved in cell wall biosynthesis